MFVIGTSAPGFRHLNCMFEYLIEGICWRTNMRRLIEQLFIICALAVAILP